MTVGETVNLNEEEEEENGKDSISQLTGLESARQSIPPLRFRLAAPVSMALSIRDSTELSRVPNYFYDGSK